LLVKISNPSARKHREERKSDGCAVFVGQLPFKATEEQLLASFSLYGEIESLKLPQDPHAKTRNKGIAFITYADAESAQAALEMNGREFQGRNLKVNLVEHEGSRRSNTRQINGRSKSPTPKANGNSASASSVGPVASDIEDQRQRTIAFCGVPDTVNEPRIRVLAEKIGQVRKVILKTNHQGALVEFENVVDAGKAAIELDGFEITPNRRIRVTTEMELLQQKPEKKVEKLGKGPPSSKPFPVAAPKRPVQAGARRGGHLGQRSAKFFRSDQANEDEKPGKKNNDDFRAMLNKS
jgi:squamous cell carcinoma antigen recognized by T-cells 3